MSPSVPSLPHFDTNAHVQEELPKTIDVAWEAPLSACFIVMPEKKKKEKKGNENATSLLGLFNCSQPCC